MSVLAFDACVNFRLLSPSTGFCDYTIIKFDGESMYIKVFIYNLIRVESEIQI